MQEGGCDCGPSCTLSEDVLNARVKDVLRVKARLGLIKNPQATFVQERPVPASDTHAPDAWIDHNEVASRLAHESTVLLQNKPADPSGAAALPAEPSTVSSIAVIGPNADAPRYGDYTGAEHHRGGNINMLNAVPLLEGIKKTYGNHARLESLAVSCPLPCCASAKPSTRLPAERAKVTHVVGATTLGGDKACGGRDGFETIFRHHFGMPMGYEHVLGATDRNSRALGRDGEGGLLAQYLANQYIWDVYM